MTIGNFIKSNLTKFEKLFFQKEITSITLIFDEENTMLKNVVYLKLDNNYIGIYLNGINPYFSTSYLDDLDLFNLYENYNFLISQVTEIPKYTFQKIVIIFNEDYNELLGFYLSDNSNHNSFAMIFMSDDFLLIENVDISEYFDILNRSLLHVKNKIVFSLAQSEPNWCKQTT